MLLDRWIQFKPTNKDGTEIFGNCLVGYVYDHPQFENGQRIITDAIRFVDKINLKAETLSTDGICEKYDLGTPGTFAEHQVEAPKNHKDLESGLIVLDENLFLNPRG